MQNVGEMELCEMIIGEKILKALKEDIIQGDIEIKKVSFFCRSRERGFFSS